MGDMLENVKKFAEALGDESLRELEKHVDQLLRMRGLKGRSSIAAEMSTGEVVSDRKGGFKKTRAYRKYADSCDLDLLAEGKGFYAVEGDFINRGQTPESDRLIIEKRLDGGMDVTWNGQPYREGESANFGGRYAKANLHPNADALWRVARYFHPESKLTLEK